MKKFIDRMEEHNPSGVGASSMQSSGGGAGSESGEAKKKGKWGIGGMVRKVTGSGSVSGAGGEKKEGSGSGEEVEPGVQVDFYLVIVCARFTVNERVG